MQPRFLPSMPARLLLLLAGLSLAPPPPSLALVPAPRSCARHPPTNSGRRRWILSQAARAAAAAAAASPRVSRAAETAGTDAGACSSSSPPAGCLGVIDGLLADCPHGGPRSRGGAGCTSSQDDTPGIFAEPWDYSDAPASAAYFADTRGSVDRLVDDVLRACRRIAERRGAPPPSVLRREGRYLRVRFDDAGSSSSTGEFYITPDDTTVQFRIAAEEAGGGGAVKNIDRAESIRKELRFMKLPVMRNRQRVFFFGESPFDTFGPGSASLGPPAEMAAGDMEGRDEPDPKVPLDFLPSPVGKRPR